MELNKKRKSEALEYSLEDQQFVVPLLSLLYECRKQRLLLLLRKICKSIKQRIDSGFKFVWLTSELRHSSSNWNVFPSICYLYGFIACRRNADLSKDDTKALIWNHLVRRDDFILSTERADREGYGWPYHERRVIAKDSKLTWTAFVMSGSFFESQTIEFPKSVTGFDRPKTMDVTYWRKNDESAIKATYALPS